MKGSCVMKISLFHEMNVAFISFVFISGIHWHFVHMHKIFNLNHSNYLSALRSCNVLYFRLY